MENEWGSELDHSLDDKIFTLFFVVEDIFK